MEFMETRGILRLNLPDFEALGVTHVGNFWNDWRLVREMVGPAGTWL